MTTEDLDAIAKLPLHDAIAYLRLREFLIEQSRRILGQFIEAGERPRRRFVAEADAEERGFKVVVEIEPWDGTDE